MIIACIIVVGIGLLAAQVDGGWCDVSKLGRINK